jgi:hypothetical protein
MVLCLPPSVIGPRGRCHLPLKGKEEEPAPSAAGRGPGAGGRGPFHCSTRITARAESSTARPPNRAEANR